MPSLFSHPPRAVELQKAGHAILLELGYSTVLLHELEMLKRKYSLVQSSQHLQPRSSLKLRPAADLDGAPALQGRAV